MITIIMQLHKEINSLKTEIVEIKDKLEELSELKNMVWKSYTAEFCKQI